MMKKIALAIALVLLALCLAGCAHLEEEPKEKGNGMFRLVENYGSFSIVYDTETRVMYAESVGTYNGGTLVMLFNADGTPKLWKGK